MEEGILNLRKQKASLEEIFTLLGLSTATDKIISLDISNYRDWPEVKDFILKLGNNLKPQSIKIARPSQYSTEHEIKISEFVNEILALRLKTGIE
ncbi:hypothetical protein A3305_02285 [Rickettsia amblyommatis]|uniref:Uncharacterized protein n=2 Tax=Rickettsia amblyommatis TaxID=33989 RepID=H8K3J1_RICAG|nr:hypothetical protein [Rickettsia amblyommatis]AFC69085.1 hypothetical protein MCE_00140 [Rickettsia amblyommatis str. GAT-30V]ARD87366.1 hypothetical protein A3305_02285 [Rickettsia amblyommatis]KJV61265.1 hypothetical protein APHACPA_0268 [Rickettsia amblyommatis str. Ac/Pa]KJV98161.1 hypothetical protein RAMDARK_0047 [Rickettsia amblyommatis str. Darkwater]